jgi:hypothetical protein
MKAGRIVLIVLGSLLILISLGLIGGGAAVLAIDANFKDAQGFYTTHFIPIQTDRPAVVSQPADINIGPSWFAQHPDAVTVKIEASNYNADRPIFIGIARETDLNRYLRGVGYDEATDYTFNSDTFHYVRHAGADTAPAPTGQTFWVASASGTGDQTLQWNVTGGTYAIILMNADGSAPLDAQVALGLKMPAFVHGVGLGLLIGGIVLLAGGGVMLFFGIKGW